MRGPARLSASLSAGMTAALSLAVGAPQAPQVAAAAPTVHCRMMFANGAPIHQSYEAVNVIYQTTKAELLAPETVVQTMPEGSGWVFIVARSPGSVQDVSPTHEFPVLTDSQQLQAAQERCVRQVSDISIAPE